MMIKSNRYVHGNAFEHNIQSNLEKRHWNPSPKVNKRESEKSSAISSRDQDPGIFIP